MESAHNIIESLERLFSEKSAAGKGDALRRITDLFVAGETCDDEQLRIFDKVLSRLCLQIETVARVALAERLRVHPNSPPNLMQQLAKDEAIEVAQPVLEQCKLLSEATLVEIAKTRGPDHLLAISMREGVSEAVTDVLVERGNDVVVLSAVRNKSARFSAAGFSEITARSTNNGTLATELFGRDDMPHQQLVKLFMSASESVRAKLETVDRRRAEEIRGIVSQVTNDLQSLARAGSERYRGALAVVHTLKGAGRLDEDKLREFADARQFEETCISLSLICDLPVQTIERGMVGQQSELLFVFSKSAGLQWETVGSLMKLRDGTAPSSQQLEVSRSTYSRLKPDTARKAVQFYRLREKTKERVCH